jgi:3-hydroxyisobutyrate dehydrogenase-like beta-hydroxyacid dehydrogenase
MGAAVAAALRRGGAVVSWCPAGRSRTSTARAAEAGLRPVADLAELLAVNDVVLSICPPAAAEDVAASVAEHHFCGLYVDANAISTVRFARIDKMMGLAGTRVVDGAIVGPPPGDGRSARFYLAGAPADVHKVAVLFRGSEVEPVVLQGGPGSASALKMAFASYQKATRTLSAVAHALADRRGVTDHLLAEAVRMGGSPLAEPEYLPSVAARAWRWAPEMLEVAETLDAHDLPDDLACAASAVLAKWECDRDLWDLPLETALSRLRDAERSEPRR